MFTLTVHDARVYQRLMEKVAQRGESLDEVLRELLDQGDDTDQTEADTPARKLLSLIDAADLPFDHPFDGRDTESLLDSETGEASWRGVRDNDGST